MGAEQGSESSLGKLTISHDEEERLQNWVGGDLCRINSLIVWRLFGKDIDVAHLILPPLDSEVLGFTSAFCHGIGGGILHSRSS